MHELLPDLRSVGIFVLVSVLMGGAAAYASGKAVAQTWRPFWHLPLYVLALAAVVRFCHFALFEQTLLDGPGYLLDLVVLMGAAGFGYRRVRTEQMLRQYAWVYELAGPLRWRPRR